MQPSEEVWWELRQLRSQPPGRATSGRRSDEFRSALEQAEQLFAAAADTPLSTRPLLAFYGVSQASRAVLAAHRHGEWKPHGHGLAAHDTSGPLRSITCRNKGTGVFDQLAGVMTSASLPNPVTLERLVVALPSQISPAPFVSSSTPQPVVLEDERYNGGAVMSITAAATAWVHGLPLAIISASDPAAAAREHLARFPTLQGWGFAGDPPVIRETADGRYVVAKLAWSLDESTGSDLVRAEVVRRGALRPPRPDGLWVVPVSVDDSERVLAPLVHWWAVLHALSTVVRYEPAAWRRHIDVDSHVDAVGLDRLVDVALEETPQHILQALREPTAWRPPSWALDS